MSSPIEMRKYLAIMRGKEPIKSAKVEETTEKDMTMRDMLGKMRKIKDKPLLNLNEQVKPLNEFVGAPSLETKPDNTIALGNNQPETADNLTTDIDRREEEEKMRKYFGDGNVTLEFDDFIVKGNGVILTGTIDGQIEFAYKVTPEEETSGVEINYIESELKTNPNTGEQIIDPNTGEPEKTKGFDAQDPENEEVVKKLKDYYNIFYKYWKNNIFYN